MSVLNGNRLKTVPGDDSDTHRLRFPNDVESLLEIQNNKS